MKVRLMGTPVECEDLVAALRALPLRVVSVSAPYVCRGESELVRVYVELRPPAESVPAARGGAG